MDIREIEMNLSNKTDVIKYFEDGLFGNTKKTYTSDDLPNSDGPFILRYLSEKGGRGPSFIDLDYSELVMKMDYLVLHEGYKKENFFIHDLLDENKIILQFEVQRDIKLELLYSQECEHFRTVIPYRAKTATGLQAKMILQGHLDPTTYDNVIAFLDKYPECVIEGTTMDHDTGTVKNRNTFIWEVRNGY